MTDCINEMIATMCRRAGAGIDSVYEVVLTGNTTMNHIILGIDPTSLAQAPYHAVRLESCRRPAHELDLRIRPSGWAYTMANIAGYVGGDTVGLILACGMHEYDGMQLALDIGTNGEIVLGGRDRLMACSAAAGPAFEGARIQHGVRAAEGAIEKVIIRDGEVDLNVIGGGPPRGICGTGVIDALAALLDAGLVESTGRLLPPDDLPEDISPALRERVVERHGQACFELARADETDGGEPICLSQRDVRQLQLAKGAIRAGAEIIMSEYGVGPDDVDRVLLAGAFGNFVRPQSVERIGLLPGLSAEKIEFVGNAAGTGAKMALADKTCRSTAENIAVQTKYVELTGRTDFQAEFAEAMLFPQG
jgi:uncharacterized 2Fe-2S/4Fe-4S cluster protein (DUF4445 family)